MAIDETRSSGGGADPAAERLRRAATYASVSVALFLMLAKLGAYLVTGSVSLLSSLIDSSTDLLASIATLVGVWHALQPADMHHRYGHGKAEALAALAQAAFIGGSSGLLAVQAINRLIRPEPIGESAVGIAVMVVSIVLTLALVTFQQHVVRRTRSLAIGADQLHYSGDLLLNLCVIAGILLTEWTGLLVVDPVFGAAIAGFLIWRGWLVGRDALDVLMDRELPQSERNRIKGIVLSDTDTRGLHDLRTRSSGTGMFIELHLELDPHLTVSEAHEITDRVEIALRAAYPGAEVMIHQEPHGLVDERLDSRLIRTSRG